MRTTLILLTAVLAALALAGACGGDGNDNGTLKPTSDATGEPSGAGEPGPDSPTVSLEAPTIATGETGEAVVTVLDFGTPGLGAWTIDIHYDPAAVAVVDCQTPSGTAVCNPEFETDVVRLAGASATGLEGDIVVGQISFQCNATGESDLTLSIDTLADGTIGDPQVVAAHVENDAITCE